MIYEMIALNCSIVKIIHDKWWYWCPLCTKPTSLVGCL